uniref:Uncharacterized protein n=1 Tax=Parascaris univalens TaxID=6257 RepID=A0A915AMD1_PARUN
IVGFSHQFMCFSYELLTSNLVLLSPLIRRFAHSGGGRLKCVIVVLDWRILTNGLSSHVRNSKRSHRQM